MTWSAPSFLTQAFESSRDAVAIIVAPVMVLLAASAFGGLGFGMKWDMGWMHDTLSYLQKDPIHRKYNHNTLTFRMIYAFSENFLLHLLGDIF